MMRHVAHIGLCHNNRLLPESNTGSPILATCHIIYLGRGVLIQQEGYDPQYDRDGRDAVRGGQKAGKNHTQVEEWRNRGV